MNRLPVIIIAAFGSEQLARKKLRELKLVKWGKLMGIQNAAVIRRDHKNKIHIREAGEPTGGRSATLGGVVGAIIGSLAGPGGTVIGGAAGAAVGGITARLRDTGIPNERLQALGQTLSPGTSAIVAVVEPQWVEELGQELSRAGAEVYTEMITAGLAAGLGAGRTTEDSFPTPGEVEPVAEASAAQGQVAVLPEQVRVDIEEDELPEVAARIEFTEPFELEGHESRYLVEAEVARGGMGLVYRAKDCTTGRVVAIKREGLEPITDRQLRSQIREQLQSQWVALGPLNHPTVLKIYDQFADRDYEYMAMELIEGPTLHQIQQRLPKGDRKIEESRVIGWALQVLDGLTYLHSQSRAIIHRDIKPHNLMLTGDGRIVLVDFGLMKQTDLRQIEETSSLVHAVGTVEYAPPEQYADSGEHTDVRTDIYSLGATLYHLLAGTLPPRSVDRLMPMSILDDIAKKPPSLCVLNPTVSRRTEQIIFKAMEVDPDIRYQTAAEMRKDFCPRGRIIHLPF